MKKIVLLLLTTLLLYPIMAQNSKNSRPDAIVGTYRVAHGGQLSKVRVYKEKTETTPPNAFGCATVSTPPLAN